MQFFDSRCSLHQIWEGYWTFIDPSKVLLVLQHVVPFRNHTALKSTKVEKRGQILHFLIACEK